MIKYEFLEKFDKNNKYINLDSNLERNIEIYEDDTAYNINNDITNKKELNIFAKMNITSIATQICVIRDNPHDYDIHKIRKSKNINYINKCYDYDGITILVDRFIYYHNKIKSKYKIAYLWESRTIIPRIYEYIINNKDNIINQFDLIITYDKEILEKYYPKAVYIPTSSPSLNISSFKSYNKTKFISFMYNETKSSKLEGYYLRKNIYDYINDNKLNINVYKKSNKKEWISKKTFLEDYMFTIICLNNSYDFYIVDALIDPLVCKTIPIYYGLNINSLNLFFNKKGFLYFSNMNEFIKIIDDLNIDYYINNYDAVKFNYKKIKEYIDIDEIIYNTINIYLKIS